MADRVRLADGTELDVQDPESIRTYVRRALALSMDPSAPQLRRLEMLEELAAKLEAEAKPTGAVVSLVDAQAASAELLRRRTSSGEK